MTIQETIQKAKDEGNYFWDPPIDCDAACDNSFLLNPAFWQCLGKALGWDSVGAKCWFCEMHGSARYSGKPEWLYHWHRFIDHLADGKTAEEFFASL
jgi:hypothetical protein